MIDLEQALTDPENQPSQWGTVPLALVLEIVGPHGCRPCDCGKAADAQNVADWDARDALRRQLLAIPWAAGAR